MKAVVINSCIKKERTDVLHHYLFHGDDYRQSNQTEIDLNHPLGDDLLLPTVIDRSGLFFPPIIMPGTSLVVDENIRNQLGKLNHEFAISRFSIEAYTTSILKILEAQYE